MTIIYLIELFLASCILVVLIVSDRTSSVIELECDY